MFCSRLLPGALLCAFFLAPQALFAQPSRVTGLLVDAAPAPTPPAVITRDDEGRVTIRAVRIDAPLTLDGQLDEGVYRSVPAAGDFLQQEPNEGAPATEKTDVWVLFDDRTLYISARCWDSGAPERLVANEMRRDHQMLARNENFAFTLDTFHDKRNSFFFHVNPLGGLTDALATDEGTNNNKDWNTVWHARTGQFDGGWTTEIAIPFKSLRYNGSGPQVWGIQFRRIVRWKNEISYLTAVPASYGMRGTLMMSLAATLVGLETPNAGGSLEFKPYAISSLNTDRLAEPRLDDDLTGDIGFDAKYGVTRGLTFDFTYNTDFAQVEDDEQQVNLTRFSLFFPEKREFFLEGLGIFAFGGAEISSSGGRAPSGDTPVIFFSRRIGLENGRTVPIRAGGRLTGRAGKYAIGALDIYTDDAAGGAIPSSHFSVVRVKRDILRKSGLGMMFTRRSPAAGGGDENLAYGVDAGLSFYENVKINAYLAATKTPGISDRDTSYRVQFDYPADRYGAQLEHLAVGGNFLPEIGFVKRRDMRRTLANVRFSPRPRSMPSIRKFSYEATLDYITDWDNRLETRQGLLTFRTELQNGDQWNVDYTRYFEGLDESFDIADDVLILPGAYHFQDLKGTYELGPQRAISGSMTVGYGSFYGGDRTEAKYTGRIVLSKNLTVEPGVTVNWVNLPVGDFVAKLVSTRVSVPLSPRMFAGALVQYNSNAHALGTNLRFRWEYEAGSDLFVVFNEGRDTLLGGRYPELQNRSFAVKITRLFRF